MNEDVILGWTEELDGQSIPLALSPEADHERRNSRGRGLSKLSNKKIQRPIIPTKNNGFPIFHWTRRCEVNHHRS